MGDIVCTTSNKYFIDNCYGGIPVLGDHKSPTKTKISYKSFRSLYKYDGKAFNTKIGFITNSSTTLYVMLEEAIKKYGIESDEVKELTKRLKLCCHFQALQIDAAKGIVVQSTPKEWYKWKNPNKCENDIDKKLIEFNNSLLIEKRPYFMRYLYPNYNKEFKEYNENFNQVSLGLFNCEINNPSEEAKQNEKFKELVAKYEKYNKFIESDDVMNNVCHQMEKECKNIKLKIQENVDESFFKIYMDNSLTIDDEKLKMMISYFEEYNKQKKNRKNIEENGSFLKYCMDLKDELFVVSIDTRELATLAVYICYVLFPNKPKDFVWDICGDGVLENIFQNKGNKEIVIPLANKNGDINYLGKNYKNVVEEID